MLKIKCLRSAYMPYTFVNLSHGYLADDTCDFGLSVPGLEKWIQINEQEMYKYI